MVGSVLEEEIRINLTQVKLLCWEEAARFKPGRLTLPDFLFPLQLPLALRIPTCLVSNQEKVPTMYTALRRAKNDDGFVSHVVLVGYIFTILLSL